MKKEQEEAIRSNRRSSRRKKPGDEEETLLEIVTSINDSYPGSRIQEGSGPLRITGKEKHILRNLMSDKRTGTDNTENGSEAGDMHEMKEQVEVDMEAVKTVVKRESRRTSGTRASTKKSKEWADLYKSYANE